MIDEDFFDSDIDISVEDNSLFNATEEQEYNLVLTAISHNMVPSTETTIKILSNISGLKIYNHIVISRIDNDLVKVILKFNSEMSTMKQVGDFLVVIYKLFGQDEDLDIVIENNKIGKKFSFNKFKNFIDLYVTPETVSYEFREENFAEDFSYICYVLIGTLPRRNQVTYFLNFPHLSDISPDVKTKLLYSYKEYLFEHRFTEKKRIRVNTKKLADMLHNIRSDYNVSVYLRTNNIYRINTTNIKAYELTEKETFEHIISCFTMCDIFNSKKYFYVDANTFQYFYNKKKFIGALAFSFFHAYEQENTLSVEYGLIIRYAVEHNKYKNGDMSPAIGLTKNIISNCR